MYFSGGNPKPRGTKQICKQHSACGYYIFCDSRWGGTIPQYQWYYKNRLSDISKRSLFPKVHGPAVGTASTATPSLTGANHRKSYGHDHLRFESKGYWKHQPVTIIGQANSHVVHCLRQLSLPVQFLPQEKTICLQW